MVGMVGGAILEETAPKIISILDLSLCGYPTQTLSKDDPFRHAIGHSQLYILWIHLTIDEEIFLH